MSNPLTHLTIIPDGDRRWSVLNSVDSATAYIKGMEVLESVVKWAFEKKILYVSFWVLSIENDKRSSDWRMMFFGLLKKYLRPKCQAMFDQNIAVKIIGDWRALENIKGDIEDILAQNPSNPAMTVIFFLRYSGTWDLCQAAAEMDKYHDKPEHILNYLQTRVQNIPDPEVLIRTSGVDRLSDYMMVQCANTELYFLDKLWPDFTAKDCDEILETFQKVERRNGK